MSSLYVVRGAFRRQALPRSHHILFGRSNFFGRPAHGEPTSHLPSTPARTRFAPSPTGYLHLGSLRTALFNYLLARATGGQFLVRVEDTDQTRLVPDAEEKLYEDLKWAGLDWDEGPDIGGPYGPYKQSERLRLYHDHVNQLLDNDRAYRCFCAPDDLDVRRKIAMIHGREYVYSKACSHISTEESARRAANGEGHCIRFRSDSKAPVMQDLVYGAYKSPVPLDDFIIIKTDGFPTYHFANVVDDHLMKITHVIRGSEWLISTPAHVALYEAFGWRPPQFAHVGLLVDKMKQKLSKRHGHFDLSSWKGRGILPIALLNYVLLLGWSPSRDGKDTSEVMDLKDMFQKFHLKFTKGDVIVNNKDKFLQKAHMRKALVSDSVGRGSPLAPLVPQFILALVRCEEDRRSQEDPAAPHRQLGMRIGPPLADWVDSFELSKGTNPFSTIPDRYLTKIFHMNGKSFITPTGFLKSNAYILWEVPEQEYIVALANQRQMLRKVVVQDACEETELQPQKISDLATTLLERLETVPVGAWTEQNIKRSIGPFIRSIGYVMDAEKGFEAWGWKFLRWVMFASADGPGLIPSMAFLGQDETLARVKRARGVALSRNV